MTQQTEAQRLADRLEDMPADGHWLTANNAASELRRLDKENEKLLREVAALSANSVDDGRRIDRLEAVNAQLLEALEMGYADTMEYIQRNHLSGAENNHWLVAARAAIEAKLKEKNT